MMRAPEPDRLLNLFVAPPAAARVIAVAAIAVLLAAATWLVHATGGVKYAFVHAMYVPVILGALVFGVRGGIVAGIAGGLLLGPYMPIDTATAEMQQLHNWLYRLAAFTIIGALTGAGAQVMRQHLRTLAWLSEHHPETGLLNLSGLLKQLGVMIAKKGSDGNLVLSVIQLNNFLETQNLFGLRFGNELLALVIERARRVAPPGALLALLQPDRLATVVAGEKPTQDRRNVVEAEIAESYRVGSVPIHLDVSVGAAQFPLHAQDAEELLQKATIAMHWARSRRMPIAIYDSANDRISRDNLILLGSLPAAIANNELKVWHQAKIALASGEVAGTEALLRWAHPELGFVPQGSFIPQVEGTLLINAVTHWLIGAAFADAAGWRAAGHRLRLSINLSVRNLGDRLLLDVLDAQARRFALAPGDVELEITETAVMADPGHCIRLISQLRERGYRIFIDDFGVGQSSLVYLQRLPVSGLKIDQEFVKTLADDASKQKIVRAILHLAQALELETVAEGVEDEPAAALLREWGCDYAQGYCFHRPAPSHELLPWLAARRGSI